VWTPRRVLLLLGGILLFGGVYGFYTRLLGWMDGLPQLPARMLERSTSSTLVPRVRTTSPTIERLREAFGPDCLEQQTAHYPTQLEFRSSDSQSTTVLACGSPPFNTNSKVISLAPFSIATIGAPKPEHLRQPGDAPEINTFHADRANLEFDRPVTSPSDMGKAKLLRMELISEPDPTRRQFDRRVGVIHITNNQRSTDPAKFLVIRTVGPLFYRDPKNVDPRSTPGPDIWTDAAVEIVDRQNLPRAAGLKERYPTFSISDPPLTAEAVQPADVQSPAAVAAVLLGQRLPPPTATAIGLKVFLDPPNQPAKPGKSPGALAGVRRAELLEKVLLHLWTDGKQGLIETGDKKPTPAAPPPVPRAELPAVGALVGGLYHGAETIRKLDRTLLQIDTLGRLAYETERNTARFDVLPDGNPDLPNDVQVHRVPPLGPGTQRLFTQVLEIEFLGSPVGSDPKKPQESLGLKQMRAWAEAPGRFVTLTSEADRLEAYGQLLVHDKPTETTTLRGKPLFVAMRNEAREDGKASGGHVLTAGRNDAPATLVLKPVGPERIVSAAIEGPGRLELFDPAANANTIQASWQTRMTVTKDVVNRRELDLFTFIDGAMFEDKRAEFWLKGKELRLWMEPRDAFAQRSAFGSNRTLPNRVQALVDVSSKSVEMEIEQADALNVLFREGVSPQLTGPVAIAPMGAPAPKIGPMSPMVPPKEEPPAKPKPPLKLKARTIDTWMVRYPLPAVHIASKNAPAPADGGSLKYELDKARCEGKVEVHQDPAEPGPEKRGLDIRGQLLILDHTPDGSVMTVTGLDEPHPGEVHHDGMSIIGAKIVLNQLNNSAEVQGRGSLVLPSNSNLSGTELKQPAAVIIHWRDAMKFEGANRWTEFQGKVTAQQNDSFVTCHIMQVRFDKPIDFSRRTPAPPGQPKDDPKIETVRCYPAAEDQKDEPKESYWVTFEDVVKDETGKPVKHQRLTARELSLTARAIEPGTLEPHQRVVADGPGNLRILQSGLKDEAAPPTATSAAKEPEVKLTIVRFAGRMTARDFGPAYQDATFGDTIELLHAPADRIDAKLDQFKLPPNSLWLNCAEKLVVSSRRKPNEPALQRMDAYGNAYIRSDQYDGWGETVSSEGPTVTLRGGETTLARITNRFTGDRSSARLLVYNRVTNKFESTDSAGGTFRQGGK
jgi:hypothetical protein